MTHVSGLLLVFPEHVCWWMSESVYVSVVCVYISPSYLPDQVRGTFSTGCVELFTANHHVTNDTQHNHCYTRPDNRAGVFDFRQIYLHGTNLWVSESLMSVCTHLWRLTTVRIKTFSFVFEEYLIFPVLYFMYGFENSLHIWSKYKVVKT